MPAQYEPGREYDPDNGAAAEEAAAPDSGETTDARTERPEDTAEHPPSGDAPGHADDGRSPEELRGALRQAEEERDTYVDHLRRERAEFENFRKRSAKEQLAAAGRGAEQIVERLLGVLDTFAFALDAAEKSEDEALAKGVQMVHTELLSQLEDAGLEEIPGEGEPFDPEIHEAMMQVEADDPAAEPCVVEVLRRGYRFQGRVLRPAAVKVAS